MEKLKQILEGSLGIVGYLIWCVISFAFYFLPVYVLDFPSWATVIAVVFIASIPILGRLLYFISWIWSFTIVISNPISKFSIIYFIVFGIYILTSVLPVIISLLGELLDRVKKIFED